MAHFDVIEGGITREFNKMIACQSTYSVRVTTIDAAVLGTAFDNMMKTAGTFPVLISDPLPSMIGLVSERMPEPTSRGSTCGERFNRLGQAVAVDVCPLAEHQEGVLLKYAADFNSKAKSYRLLCEFGLCIPSDMQSSRQILSVVTWYSSRKTFEIMSFNQNS